MVVPKKEKYRKRFRGKMRGVATRGSRLAFGELGLKALERHWLSEQQLESARQAIVHKTKREGRIWIRVVNDHPITSRPSGSHMGGGKGDIVGHVAVVRPGRIIFELGGVTPAVAREALRLAADKLPFKTKIIGR